MSDVMCQLIYKHRSGGRDLANAMEEAFCEMPSEIVGLAIEPQTPDCICFSRINMPMFVGFDGTGAYLASSPTAFPARVKDYRLLPARSSGRVYKDHAEVTAISAFYRRHTRIVVTALLEKYVQEFNINIADISINGARKRFGSCNTRGCLNFSWHLGMYPVELIELVVLHELAHRKEMNHSKAFYAVLASMLPDHQVRERDLKLWSRKLAAYPR